MCFARKCEPSRGVRPDLPYWPAAVKNSGTMVIPTDGADVYENCLYE
jgi:hypothetical protein